MKMKENAKIKICNKDVKSLLKIVLDKSPE